MGRIPSVHKGLGWYLRQANFYDIAIATFTAIVGISAAFSYSNQNRAGLGLLVGLATLGVFSFAIVKNGILLLEAYKKESVHELEGCLHTLLAVLKPTAKNDGKVRLAIYIPVEDDKELEQVTPYIGDKPRSGRVGRRFPSNAGIIGRVFEDPEHQPLALAREDDDFEAYVDELVQNWNFRRSQAVLLKRETMSWMAVQFYDATNDVRMGLLYLDSEDPDFFTPIRQELVLSAVNGIAIFIGKRYS